MITISGFLSLLPSAELFLEQSEWFSHADYVLMYFGKLHILIFSHLISCFQFLFIQSYHSGSQVFDIGIAANGVSPTHSSNQGSSNSPGPSHRGSIGQRWSWHTNFTHLSSRSRQVYGSTPWDSI